MTESGEDAKYSKDSDFERYKRKKKEERDYQFKKKGRNIFDSDKGEEGEEAYDYYDFNSAHLKRQRKTKKYAKTVNDEEEKKLDFGSNIDNSYVRGESYYSNSQSDEEDRFRAFDGNYRKHHRNQSSLIDENFLDSYNNEETINEDDKHIMISEKYSIEVDHTEQKHPEIEDYFMKQSLPTPEEKYNQSSSDGKAHQNSKKSDQKTLSKGNESKEESPAAKVSVLSNIKTSKQQKEISGSEDHISDAESSKKHTIERVNSHENNNLDLRSVRSSSKYNTEEENKEIDDTSNDKKKATLFSDLSKDFIDSQRGALSNTIDLASLAKLRRMFGSEKLIREYRTSEDYSHSQYHLEQDSKLHTDEYNKSNIKREILQEDLLIEQELHQNIDEASLPINLVFSPREDNEKDRSDAFMATNELIDLFTSEGAHKKIETEDIEIDEQGQTQNLFEKNPFKDFTMTKIHEVLQDKNFDQMQQLHKEAIDYRASVENKLLKKLENKESPRRISSKRIDIEKWVNNQLNDIEQERDLDKTKQKTIKTICDTNIYTERIFDLIQRLNTTESNLSCQLNQEKVLERNTIEELLKTDSDNSPEWLGQKENIEEDKNSNDKSEKTNNKIKTEESNNTEDLDVLETTQELINKNFDHIIQSKIGIEPNDTDEDKEDISEKAAESVVTFQPKPLNDNSSRESDKFSEDDNEEDIIATEVDLATPQKELLVEEISENNEPDKLAIAENILSTLIREIQEFPFPLREVGHEEQMTSLGSKYSEKAVFHIKTVPDQLQNTDQNETSKDGQDLSEESESMEDAEDEIMMNFNIMRNFEMKRTRFEKNQYDSQIFVSYVDEVFDAIKSKAYLFLKAFSKPIQKDFLECLTKLHYHGLVEEPIEDLESSVMNELEDQSSILTIDLYLSLEKKREEENDKIRKLDINDLEDKKMPIGLLKGNKHNLDKSYLKGKLSIFAECEHIHNKAIFDSINEALDLYRPHSKKGEPLPWTGKGGFLVDYTKTEISADNILNMVMNTLLDWNSFKVGPLPCREFYHNNIFDEEKFADFREKKLATILAYDVEKDDQEKWLDYESEESQVKLDLADIVLDKLVEETISILSSIEEKNNSL